MRAPERRLAAAGLADEADGLAAADVEVDAVDGLELAGGALEEALLDGEVLLQSADAEQDVVAGRSRVGGPSRRRRRLDAVGAFGAHEAMPIGFVARGPFSHSQQADSCAPTVEQRRQLLAQRSKT